MHIILATHGNLAKSYKETASMIAGSQLADGLKTVCMDETSSVDDFALEAKAILDQDKNGQYLILVDLYGASPCNTMISVFRSADYRIVTGFTLGMLLEALFLKDNEDIQQVATTLEDCGKEGIKTVFLHI